RKSGEDFHAHLALSLLRDNRFGVTGMIGYSMDITEQKRAEAARRESEGRFRGVFEAAAIGVAVGTLDGRSLESNRMLQEMLGYSGEELRRMVFTEFTHPDDVAADREQYKELVAGKFNHYKLEKRYIRKDGQEIWGRLTVSLVRGAEDEPRFTISMVEDITERKRAEEALRESEEQFRQAQKMEAVGQLAGGVAHDFNNLLMVMRGYGELMLNRLDANDPLRRNAEEIQKAAERATALTQQLLAFSRKQVLQPKVLDLNAVVTEVEKMLRRLIGEDIELTAVLDLALGPVKADPGQIEQIILNLAVNARDAMPQGGRLTLKTANVTLDQAYVRQHMGATPGPYVLLAVSDTGVGMDAETRSHIFEPFFTTKGAGKGTGLGLSTVYGIVKQSGGTIWVESAPGRGTTFEIYLPLVEETAANGELHRALPAPTPGGTETILVVEDEMSVRKLAAEFLGSNGYRVLEAQDGAEALQVCEEHRAPIHLLLTDVVMPGMSGRELAVRLVGARPEMKVIYVSGYTDDAIVQHGVREEGTVFLQKPFSLDALARTVREALDSKGKK
ncbi:MAG: PAS domain S-box protein, partial [Acidobacteria bacterium]|nr:PAS domain S-box protein [Acidobacteriota bacterium]